MTHEYFIAAAGIVDRQRGYITRFVGGGHTFDEALGNLRAAAEPERTELPVVHRFTSALPFVESDPREDQASARIPRGVDGWNGDLECVRCEWAGIVASVHVSPEKLRHWNS